MFLQMCNGWQDGRYPMKKAIKDSTLKFSFQSFLTNLYF